MFSLIIREAWEELQQKQAKENKEPGNHPCSPKETRYGTLRRCGPAHGGVKTQRVPCHDYFERRWLS